MDILQITTNYLQENRFFLLYYVCPCHSERNDVLSRLQNVVEIRSGIAPSPILFSHFFHGKEIDLLRWYI